jgi:hypothetical protein
MEETLARALRPIAPRVAAPLNVVTAGQEELTSSSPDSPDRVLTPNLENEALASLLVDYYAEGRLSEVAATVSSYGQSVSSLAQRLEQAANEVVREKLQGIDFQVLSDEGGVARAYASPMLPGFVVKAPRKEEQMEKYFPGYWLAKDTLGDLFVVMVIQDVNVLINGVPTQFPFAVVQEKVILAGDLLSDLDIQIQLARNLKQGDQARLREAQKREMQDRFLNLSRQIWMRGVVDNDFRNWRRNYGLTARGDFVLMDADMLSAVPTPSAFETLRFIEDTNDDEVLGKHFTTQQFEVYRSDGIQQQVRPKRVPDVWATDIRRAQLTLLRKLLNRPASPVTAPVTATKEPQRVFINFRQFEAYYGNRIKNQGLESQMRRLAEADYVVIIPASQPTDTLLAYNDVSPEYSEALARQIQSDYLITEFYPSDGAVFPPEQMPGIIIHEEGTPWVPPTHSIPVLNLSSRFLRERLNTLTPGLIYAIALYGVEPDLLLGAMTFEDEQGRIVYALFA